MNRFKVFKIFCFILSVAAAVYYPVKKVIQYECHKSEVFEFKVTGRDPYDPARGRFLALAVHPVKLDDKLRYKAGYFAVLGKDKDNYASIVDIVSAPDGRSCVKLVKAYSYIRYPFERFYINEELAPAAEKVFNDAVAAKKRCVLSVRVYPDGASAVNDLLIDNVSIKKLAMQAVQDKK